MKYFSTALLALLMMAPVTQAVDVTSLTDICTVNMQATLGREQRLYRRTLFGMQHAAAEDSGAVRFDTSGNAWTKVKANTWRTDAKGYVGTSWPDAQMDTMVERDLLNTDDAHTFRTGLFASRGELTSEIIPALTQSFRALQCRTLSACKAMEYSLQGVKPENGFYNITIDGCRTIPEPALTQCMGSERQNVTNLTPLLAACGPLADSLLSHESETLKLAVGYDAAYRSLLQFAGTFDDFLSVFRLDLLRPIRQSLPLLQQLSRIPCFLSQCNG